MGWWSDGGCGIRNARGKEKVTVNDIARQQGAYYPVISAFILPSQADVRLLHPRCDVVRRSMAHHFTLVVLLFPTFSPSSVDSGGIDVGNLLVRLAATGTRPSQCVGPDPPRVQRCLALSPDVSDIRSWQYPSLKGRQPPDLSPASVDCVGWAFSSFLQDSRSLCQRRGSTFGVSSWTLRPGRKSPL